jgi:hypothetical protein
MIRMSTDQQRPPRVFVSYSHDSAAHKELVRRFATFLRAQAGVDVHLDRWYDDGRRDWSVWAIEQLREADFILVIASPDYRRRADGQAPPEEGRGAQFEAAIIRDNLTRNLPGETRRVLPVVLPGRSVDEIPTFLCAYSTTHYIVSEFTQEGIDELLVAFTGVPRFRIPDRGTFNPFPAGTEVAVGDRVYVVPEDFFGEGVLQDLFIHRQAQASLGDSYVWLRQVERVGSVPARAGWGALEREYGLLERLQGVPGVPPPVDFAVDSNVATLVTGWPAASSGPAASLQPPERIDPLSRFDLLNGLAEICRTLAGMHGHGVTHRNLTPAALIQHDRLMLRDLGLAATDYRPDEGPTDYQAPEQSRRGTGQIGPRTDVYQVAALAYHLLTGRPPHAAKPIPVQAQFPGELAKAIDKALAAEPAVRPDIDTLAAALLR